MESFKWGIQLDKIHAAFTGLHMGKVTKLQLSCYLVLLSIDIKTR